MVQVSWFAPDHHAMREMLLAIALRVRGLPVPSIGHHFLQTTLGPPVEFMGGIFRGSLALGNIPQGDVQPLDETLLGPQLAQRSESFPAR